MLYLCLQHGLRFAFTKEFSTRGKQAHIKVHLERQTAENKESYFDWPKEKLRAQHPRFIEIDKALKLSLIKRFLNEDGAPCKYSLLESLVKYGGKLLIKSRYSFKLLNLNTSFLHQNIAILGGGP